MIKHFFIVLIIVLISTTKTHSACSAIGKMPQFSCEIPTTNEDRRPNKEKLSIVTFNAEWLFYSDGKGGPSTKCPSLTPSGMCPWTSVEEAEKHLSVVAQDLKLMNADVIMMEEVQDCVALQCVIEAMGDFSYKPYLIKGTDTATMQNVGMISRVDPRDRITRTENRATIFPGESKCGSLNDPSYESGVSKNIIARFTINSIPITIIGLHLLSQPTNPINCIRREAQASVIQRIISEEQARNSTSVAPQIIVLGDLNDYDATIKDINNNVPTSRVSHFLTHNPNNQQVLWSVANRVSQSLRFTNWWDKNNDCIIQKGELSMIDHIYISKTLQDNIQTVKYWNSLDNTCGTYRSDHYAVQVDINMAALEKSQKLNGNLDSSIDLM